MGMKCIDKVLLELSARSPDGLASGIFAPENIAVFREILTEQNLSPSDVEEAVSEVLAMEAQPRDPSKPRKLTAKQIAKAERDAAEKARVAGIDPNVLSADSLRDLKEIKEKIDEMLSIAEKYPVLKENYNKLSVEAAIEFANNAQNATAVAAMSGLKGSTLGEGELLLVFLIKDAISGGTKSGDIEVGGQKIDVKKLDKWKFRVELASFDGFSSTEFNAAISELIHFAVDKKNAEVLKKLVDAADNKDITQSNNYANKFKITTKKFFDSPDVELFRKGVVMCLVGVGIHISKMDKGKPAADYADFVIDHDKTTLNVDNAKEIEAQLKQQSMKSPESQPQNVVVKLSPIDDEESQMILPKIKRLKYFTERFGPKNIANSVLPRLHYDSIIFYDPVTKNGNGKPYRLMSKAEVTAEFEFYGWAKAPVFNLTSRPDDSYASEDDLDNLST